MTVGELRARARAAGDTLGDAPDAVARTLAQAGATGPRGSTSAGPVDRYFADRLPGLHVRVGVAEVLVWEPADPPIMALCPLPSGVRQFLRAFAHGQYPELDQEEGDPHGTTILAVSPPVSGSRGPILGRDA